MALSTVSAVLNRIGLGKLSRLEPPEPIRRYEKQRPGELIHIDVKKLVRIEGGAGHRVTGSAPGTAEGEPARLGARPRLRRRRHPARLRRGAPRERAPTAIGFLKRAIAFYAAHGIAVESGDDRQRARLASRSPMHSPAGHWASATFAPAPTGLRPTARQSASSARCSAAGPTGRSTATRASGPPPYPAGWPSITGEDRTAPSVTSRPGLGSPS